MANSNVQVAASQLQRAATDIKNNIWAIQRDFHDQQVQLKKEIDDLTKRIHECEAEMSRGSSEPARQLQLSKEIIDNRKLISVKQQQLADSERQANQLVHDKEAAAAELASKAGELAQKAGDPKFS